MVVDPRDLDRGWFVEPTVFTDVRPDATIAQEEIFGPVVAVIPYQDEDEAIAIANNSRLRAQRIGVHLATSSEDCGLRHASTPARSSSTATRLASGHRWAASSTAVLGREFGPEGLDAFVETKSIGLAKEVADVLQ